MLVWLSRVLTAWRWCRIVIDQRSDLGRRACHAPIRWHRTARGTGHAVRWRWRDARGLAAKVGIRNAVGRGWRLVRRHLLMRRQMLRLMLRSRMVWCRRLLRRQLGLWRDTTMGRWRHSLRLLVVRSQLILARWACLARRHLLLWHPLALVVRVHRLRWHCRVLHVRQTASTPVVAGSKWRGWRTSRRRVLCVRSPLRPWRTSQRTRLVRLRVNVLRQRRATLVWKTISWLALE